MNVGALSELVLLSFGVLFLCCSITQSLQFNAMQQYDYVNLKTRIPDILGLATSIVFMVLSLVIFIFCIRGAMKSSDQGASLFTYAAVFILIYFVLIILGLISIGTAITHRRKLVKTRVAGGSND